MRRLFITLGIFLLYTIQLIAQDKISIAIIGEAVSCSKDFANSIAATSETVVSQNQRFYAIKPEVYKHILDQLDQQKDPNYVYSTTFAQQFKAIGAQFILYTNIVGCGAEESRDKDGKFLGYNGWVQVSASVVDLATTTSKFSTQFKANGSTSADRTSSQADATRTNSVKKEIQNLLKNAFPFEVKIVKMTETNKDKAEEMVISAGSEMGVVKGDFFDVIIMDDIDGEAFEKNVGRIQVKEVNGNKMSTAKPTKGAKDILGAFNGQKRIVLRSSDHRPIIDFGDIIQKN